MRRHCVPDGRRDGGPLSKEGAGPLGFLARAAAYVASSFRLGVSARDRWRLLWAQLKNARVRLGLDAHRPDRVYTVRTVYGPLHFRDNFGDITNVVDLLHRQVYRPREIAGPGAIVDVGANIGLAAVLFHHFHPDRRLYCFEPVAENIELLERNCPDAVVEQVALGAREGRVHLRVDADRVMASAEVRDRETGEESFAMTSLDRYAERRGIGRVALLKVDAEGMELDVLEGAREVLGRTGRVVMETHGADRHERAKELLGAADLVVDEDVFDGATGLLFAGRKDEPPPADERTPSSAPL